MAWGGAVRSTAAVIATAALLGLAGCADEAPPPDPETPLVIDVPAGLGADGVVALAAAVERPYVDLVDPATGDVLAVDAGFGTDTRASAVVAAWRRLSATTLGPTTSSYEHGLSTVAVDSGGGLLHDVAEAARVAPPPAPSTWRFAGNEGVALVHGRVTASDVALVERVQAGVLSPSLGVAAARWRLERRATRLLLDLWLPGAVPPEQLVPATWAHRLAPLVTAARTALGRPSRPAELRLLQAVDGGTDVVAWWSSDHPPAPGRDRLRRGWDAWLASRAG